MADDQLGQRADAPRRTPWTKIFSTFKVALDVKKLLLAAAGIVVMALGWLVLSEVFFLLGGQNPPLPKDYITSQDPKEQDEQWEAFKIARHRWNLRFQLAGRSSASNAEVDDADLALSRSYKEYLALVDLKGKDQLRSESVQVKSDGKSYWLQRSTAKDYWTISPLKAEGSLADLKDRTFLVRDIVIVDEKEQTVALGNGGPVVKIESKFDTFKSLRNQTNEFDAIGKDIAAMPADQKRHYETALEIIRKNPEKKYKPNGQFRTLPWFENRGPNPYLLVTGKIKEPAEDPTKIKDGASATARRNNFDWFASSQVPVLLEPLFKFLRPVIFLFEANAGFWNRLYLFLIILWTIFTWGFFGGAICRMAAVQLARNEKVGMREALAFARQRCRSYFFGPVLPLLFLGLLTFFLIVFGTLIGHTYFFGDIFLVPLLFPLILIFGLIMAVVLVGLVGYPLMNPTISTEGTDSFDALSRSYSYVYQAPWHYLWYSFLALLYGAALIFFVGLMGSLMVYLGKWGLSQAPWLASASPAKDREPAYLFVWSPTSFGWRDLLIGDSRFAEAVVTDGVPTVRMTEEYMKSISIPNYIGTFFVSIWVYLFFLLIIGFGYSYFWTAATLIYLLMRRHVDDTDIDEVYLEEEEGPDAFTQEMMTTPAPTAPTGTPPGAAPQPGFQMVDSPSLRTAAPPATSPPATSPPVTSPPATLPPTGTAAPATSEEPPVSRSKHTMLAPSENEKPHAQQPLSSPDEADVRRSDEDKPTP